MSRHERRRTSRHHRHSAALQLAGLYLPFLRDLLHTQPLTLTDLAVVFAPSTLGYAAVRLDRLVHPPRAGADVPGTGVGGRSQ